MSCITTSLVLPSLGFAQGAVTLQLPKPGTMVGFSEQFTPALIKGLRIHPENPFLFDFILDAGKNNLNQQELQSESEKMVKYFLAALTVPEKDMWVNLSPYEKSRILPDAFSHTDLGRDLLGEDYLLKQTAASAIFPEKELGKAFWSHVYKLAKEKYGTTEIPVSSFNKVWIVAGKVSVYEKPQAVYIVDSHLNVMLQEDYLATQKSSMPASSNTSCPQVSLKDQIANKISREIVLPEIEKEINEGRNFALLRQAYQSVILATWFKRALKDSILNEMYADKNKVTGIDNISSLQKQEIYDRYLQAYKKGAFNYIKDETDALTNQTISKKYFSGGMRLTPGNFEMASPAKARRVMVEATNYDLKVNLGRSSRAMVSTDSAMLYEQKNVPSNTPNVLEATDADIIFPNNPPVESVDPIDVHALREFNTLASRQVSSLKEKVDSLILDPSERISLNQLNVELKLVSDDKITKGFALSRKNKIIYVTRSFLDKILKTSDQNNFIAGMCLSLIADTGENKNENDKNFLPQDRGNQLWYLYAKSIDPSVDRRLFADDANPDKLITKIISNLLLDDKTEEQYKKEFSGLVSAVIKKESFSKFVPNENDRDEFFNNLIREKYINSAGVILKKGRVDQKKFQGFQLESKFLYLINDIKREFENAIYNQQELIKNIKKLDFVGPQIKDKFDDEEVVREARKMAYSAAYLMAFNALSGIAVGGGRNGAIYGGNGPCVNMVFR